MWNQVAAELKSVGDGLLVKAVVSLLGVFGLSALVLRLAPTSSGYRLLIVLTLFACWFLFMLVATRGARAGGTANAAKPQAEAAEDRAAGAPGLQLEAALQWLESTTDLSRRDAANDRPWYLTIGGKSSGKTSLLAGSGIGIQYPPWGQTLTNARARSGYSVYITRQAVVIDTPGEFLAQGAGTRDLHLLLRQVRRVRRQPFNGILLVIDADELLNLTPEKLEQRAIGYRDVLRNARQALHRNLPVYLIVSKCDRIPDFAGFFGGLRLNGPSAPPWGFVLSNAERDDAGWRDHCDRELCGLYQRLVARRVSQLGALGTGDPAAIYLFPENFQTLRARLGILLDPLFRKTQKQGPLLRGVFLTAALGTAEPALATAEGVHRRFKDSARALLNDIILAHPSRGTASRRREVINVFDRRTIALAASTLGLVLLMGLAVIPAYGDNVRLIAAVQRMGEVHERAIPDRLQDLAELHRALLALGADEHVAPTRRRHWTLFVGEPTMRTALQLYEASVRKVFIESAGGCRDALASALRNSDDGEPLYRQLKTHLMITAPGKPWEDTTDNDRVRDTRFLLASDSPLQTCWMHATTAENAEHLELYVHRLVEHEKNSLRPGPDAAAIMRVRTVLANQDPIQAYYTQLRTLASDGVPAIDLESAGPGVLSGSSETIIPGAFTRNGWEQLVRPRIQELTDEYRRERAWVLGLTVDPSAIRTELWRRYFADYGALWTAAIQATRLSSFGSWNTAPARVVALSGTRPEIDPSDSAYFRFIKLISHNTWGDAKDDLSSAPQELGAIKKGFQSLHQLVAVAEGKPADIQPYLVALHGVYLKMSVYPSAESCAEKLDALPDLGQVIRRAGEVVAQLRPRIEPLFANVRAIFQEPLDYVGRMRTRDVNICQAPGPNPSQGPSPAIAAPKVTLRASATAITSGQPSVLEWTSENAASVTINPGLGGVPTMGSAQVRPSETTTYTVVATGTGGALAEHSVTIAVTPPSHTVPLQAPTSSRVTVSGVVSGGQEPAAKISVFLRRVDTRVVMKATTTPDGRVRFQESIDPSFAYEICVLDDATCAAPEVLENGKTYQIQDREWMRVISFRSPTRRYDVRINLGG